MHTATVEKVLSVMGDRSREIPQIDKALLLQEFKRAKDRTPGISMLLLTTADGRALAELDERGGDPRRLAAMTNSFLTLGETVAKELGLASADYATIATRQGNMVLIRMEHTMPMTLAALGTFETNVAVLLFAARECATRLSALLPK
ncbi:putative regulator of Ras-like GTPase activity (Roadblock/LC7/MglB family) [Pseudoxanthomonas japonensis]|uniref:roadblock/LC7 domain-containing protein n=1 Tax=Pseudoxanthomonas TaxID=83618 RepID=UPI000AF2E620|nr:MULTISPECIES: roadblock/LC7 domain-containing protein [Pseudoxanthomonas]MDR7070381.1 putative regulator of Ras-like GTPase activity (Roadblock/LC7/MglB family) [Pseudoxanthomonas japonensis]